MASGVFNSWDAFKVKSRVWAKLSRSRPVLLGAGRRSITQSDQKRALMLPQELMQMNADALIVLKAGNDIAAFALGAFDLIDIFKTKPPFRRIGIGRTLAHY